MKRIHFLRDEQIQQYGHPLHRIPIDLGESCPHRDTEGNGGCSFCNAYAGRSMQTLPFHDWTSQVNEALRFAKSRYKAQHFMAYLDRKSVV